MSLYFGRQKIAGNSTTENVKNDIANYSLTFDDSGTLENPETLDTINLNLSSGALTSDLFRSIKKAFIYISKEIYSLKTGLTNKLDINLFTSHKTSGDHDNRYYTEAEVDSKINAITNTVGNYFRKSYSFTVSEQGKWIDTGQSVTLSAGTWIIITSINDQGYSNPGIWTHSIPNIGVIATYWRSDGNYSNVFSPAVVLLGDTTTGNIKYFCSYCNYSRTVTITVQAVQIK